MKKKNLHKNSYPLVSIVVPNYNTLSVIDSVVNNFSKIDYSPLEIIFVDDCSKDGSFERLKELSKDNERLKVIQNDKNYGPSHTRNHGIKEAKGKYIALLETDMEADKGYLKILIDKLEADETLGAAQSLVMDLNKRNIISADGLYFDPHTFFVYSQNVALPKHKAKNLKERFCSIGAVGSVIRKDVLDVVGGYDEKIVHNIDDIDLGWRIWVYGKKILFVPNAITYHWTYKKLDLRQKVTPKVSSEFHFQKTLRIFIKNYEWINILRYTPWLYFAFISRAIINLIKGNSAPLKGLWMATKWLAVNLPENLRERKRIQGFRGMSDKQIFKNIFLKGSFFENYYKKIIPILQRCEKIF